MLKATRGYLICKQQDVETRTKSGLFMPSNTGIKPHIAEVIEAGEGVVNCKVGDKVVYKSYSGTDVRYDGEDYIIIADEDLIARIG